MDEEPDSGVKQIGMCVYVYVHAYLLYKAEKPSVSVHPSTVACNSCLHVSTWDLHYS